MSESIWPEGTEQVVIEAMRQSSPEEAAGIVLQALGEVVQREFVSRAAVRQAELTLTGKANISASVWGEDSEAILTLRACAQLVHEVLDPPAVDPKTVELMNWLEQQGYLKS